MRLVLTTGLVGAAAMCLGDQLLSRFIAGGTGHRGALNRLTLGHHGTFVTFTQVAAIDPCLTRLVGEELNC